MRYGLPASPSKCEVKPWKATAVALLVGMTTYYKERERTGSTEVMAKQVKNM